MKSSTRASRWTLRTVMVLAGMFLSLGSFAGSKNTASHKLLEPKSYVKSQTDLSASDRITAKWIWAKQKHYRAYNQTIVADKAFQVGDPVKAIMRITADSFYRLPAVLRVEADSRPAATATAGRLRRHTFSIASSWGLSPRLPGPKRCRSVPV